MQLYGPEPPAGFQLTGKTGRQNSDMLKFEIPARANYIKFSADCDFFDLFRLIESEHDICFFLESLGEDSDFSRYSLIGFDPDLLIRGRNIPQSEKVSPDEPAGELIYGNEVIRCSNPYQELQKIIPQNIISRNYAGGLVGYLGYDAANFFEPSLQLQQHADFDPFMFGLYTDGLIFDKLTGELIYFYYDHSRMERVRDWVKRSEEMTAKMSRSVSVRFLAYAKTEAEHQAMVEEALEEIRSGNTFQCQIGFLAEYQIEGNSLAIYERLRDVSPSPHMFFIKFGEKKIIGASPELVFRLRQGEMETYPLAGTTTRGKSTEEDRALAKDLLNDPKEIAEHNMLVDLHRNDLGRVARFGTVKVRRLMDVKRFSHVQHISSEVVGIIRRDCDMFRGLESVFPAGTLSGAPKIESMKIIERIENSPRGPYGGAVGHFGFNGDSTFAIPIRTLFMNGSRAFARASGGIVYDSVPEYEYREIMRKLSAMERTLSHFMDEKQ